MLVAPHFLVGAAIASHAPHFWPAVLAAITSHFVLDSIPHRDTIGGFHLNRANVTMEVLDISITLVIFLLIVPKEQWWYSFVVGGAAILPDLVAIPKLFWPLWSRLPILGQFDRWHTKSLQPHNERINWLWGLLPQILLIIIAMYFIITKPLL